jgi:hypothetical protein
MNRENHTTAATLHQVVVRMYRCNDCGWYGDRAAHCTAIIVGGEVTKATIAMSVCPHCNGLFSSLRRVFITKSNPPNPPDQGAASAPLHPVVGLRKDNA